MILFLCLPPKKINIPCRIDNGNLVAWVKTDILDAKDTYIYLYYSNALAANQENPESVWSSNFVMVKMRVCCKKCIHVFEYY